MFNLPSNLWPLVIISIKILVIISQLGGITVLIGAGLFAANRVNLGKLWIGIGTGQGLFTIALRIIFDVWYGRIDLANNYVLWLMSSAVGLAIVFSDNLFLSLRIISQYLLVLVKKSFSC